MSCMTIPLPVATYDQYRISYATYTRYMERILALGAPNRAGPVDLEPKGIKWVTKNLPSFLKQLGIPDVVGGLQTSAILGTQRLLKNVLSL